MAIAIERPSASTPIARGNVAKHGHRFGLFGVDNDLGAFFEHLIGILGQQSDQLLAPFGDNVRPFEAERLPTKVRASSCRLPSSALHPSE